jgi:hypothetical protein
MPYPFGQCTGPVGVLFTSWTTAFLIRRQTRYAVVIVGGRELIGTRFAFLERLLAVSLEH